MLIEAGSGLEREIASGGQPVVLDDVAAEKSAPLYRQAGVRSFAGVALLVEGQVIGVLDVGAIQPRSFSAADVELLQLATDRIAPAIDRARLYEREHRIAETLQRSLLPKRLPTIPAVDLAVCYRPAGDGVHAGGDWYDVFQLPHQRIAVAMGDVAAHGIEAVSLMGQPRIGLRAYATEGHAPCEVATRLD